MSAGRFSGRRWSCRSIASRLAVLVGVLLGSVLAPTIAAPLRAQADPMAAARLDAPSRLAVQRILDSARAGGLPVEPLVSKVLEGSAKGAPGPRIVQVVRALERALGDSRAALGAAATEAELVAGAAALQAGLAPGVLVELRRARGVRPLAGPLVVLADLVTRGVPPAAASDAVLRLARANAADASFAALRRDVERDIAAGAAPAAAAALRAGSLAPAPVAPAPTAPPSPEVP
jgi:hypothetical protein